MRVPQNEEKSITIADGTTAGTTEGVAYDNPDDFHGTVSGPTTIIGKGFGNDTTCGVSSCIIGHGFGGNGNVLDYLDLNESRTRCMSSIRSDCRDVESTEYSETQAPFGNSMAPWQTINNYEYPKNGNEQRWVEQDALKNLTTITVRGVCIPRYRAERHATIGLREARCASASAPGYTHARNCTHTHRHTRTAK